MGCVWVTGANGGAACGMSRSGREGNGAVLFKLDGIWSADRRSVEIGEGSQSVTTEIASTGVTSGNWTTELEGVWLRTMLSVDVGRGVLTTKALGIQSNGMK